MVDHGQLRARERLALRFIAVLSAAVVIYHFEYGLSWSTTAALLVVVAVGGILYRRFNRRRRQAPNA